MNIKELINVSKPARYIGGELNSIIKDSDNLLDFCLIFPDIYEIGSSHVGYKLLYERVNKSDKVYCQRFFAPWKDALDYFGKDIFISLEKSKPLSEFDVLGFSIHYEMSYTTVLGILKYSEIPYKTADRGENYPIIMAGGSCTYNPAPLTPFIDVFYIGEGDINLRKVLEHIKELKDKNVKKSDILKELNKYPFLFVPSVESDKKVMRDIFIDFNKSDFEYAPVVPLIPAIQDRVSVEIARGCTAGCRFCQAGMIYRPVRERNTDNVINDVLHQIEKTGHQEASLLSLSTGDYSQIEPLILNLNKKLSSENVSLSTPSLRANSVSETLFKEISKVRKSGFTIAPEAGTQRMRDIINKNISEEDILSAVKLAAENGYTSVKLYFMIGLPYETDEDIIGIADTASKIKKAVQEVKKGSFDISVSVSHFVPKPHTPFQMFGQVPKQELERRMYMLKDELRRRKFKFKFHDTRMSLLEAFLSRGNIEVSKALEYVVEHGFYLDAWDEFTDYNKWTELCSEIGIDISLMAEKSYQEQDILPWSNILTGVNDKFYQREIEKAEKGQATVDCRNGKCSACGVCDFKELQPQKSEDVLNETIETKSDKKICQYEVVYEKYDRGVFFSALDLNRIFIHSLLVSGVELSYSQGFNPHPKINTWIPLPVGMAGENEIMSFESSMINMDIFLNIFNQNLPKGLKAKSIRQINSMKTGTEFISTYKLLDETNIIFQEIKNNNKLFYNKKDKKGGLKSVNIEDYLINYDSETGIIILKAGNAGGFNLIELMRQYMPLQNINIVRIKVEKDETGK